MFKNVLIVLLLALNVALITVVYHQYRNPVPDKNPPVQPTHRAEISPDITPSAHTLSTLAEQNSNRSALADSLSDLDTGDYVSFIDGLRSLGVSEALLKQFLTAAVEMDHRRYNQSSEVPYWRQSGQEGDERILQQLQLEAEQRDQLVALFGAEVRDDPAFEHLFKPLSDTLPFLDPDKQVALDTLLRQNRAENRDVRGRGRLVEDRQEQRDLSGELALAIQELLTVDEYNEYQLRTSPLANAMKRGMNGLDYSEQEYRDIYDIRRDVNDRLDLARNSGGGVDRETFQEARAESNARVKEYLGDARYEEYARLQDPTFRSLQEIGSRYGATDRDIVDVYEIASEKTDEIRSIMQNQSLSEQQRRSQVSGLQSDLYDEVEALVGEEAATSVRRNTRLFRGPGRR